MTTSTPLGTSIRRYGQRLVDWLADQDPTRRSAWQRYAVALALTLLAAWLRVAMGAPEAGGRFITLALAAAFATLYGGFGAGLLSALLGMVLVNVLLIEPYFSTAIAQPSMALRLNASYLAVQLVIVGVIALLQRQNRQLRKATAHFEQNRRMLEDTFEQSATGMAHTHIDGRWIRYNQRYCDLLGYSKEEMARLSFRELTHPQDRERNLCPLHSLLEGEINHYSFEKRYLHKQGHEVWVYLTISLVRDASGKPDYLTAVVQDINDRKATEQALRTSEQLLRQAHQLAGLVSWQADVATRRFTTLSDARGTLRLPSATVTGEELLVRMPPGDRQRVTQYWMQAVKGTRPYDFECQMRFDGTERWFTVQAEFERDAQGRAVRALGILQDITQRKHNEVEIQRLNASLEQRIRQRTQALEAAYEELESYSYAVAHDLRSPLRIINGFAQALREENTALDAASQSHLDRIMAASKKMGELIDGLLSLAQLGRGELKHEPVDLSTVATRLLEEFAATEPERRVRWQVEPGLSAMGDPRLIEALLQNLLHNAWKYTAQTPDALVRVYQQPHQGTQAFFCVSDNGVGFDMARAGKLFQPFQRLHMPHEFSGLGIGLATARRIVQRHGGLMYAEAAPGRGATFRFSLG